MLITAPTEEAPLACSCKAMLLSCKDLADLLLLQITFNLDGLGSELEPLRCILVLLFHLLFLFPLRLGLRLVWRRRTILIILFAIFLFVLSQTELPSMVTSPRIDIALDVEGEYVAAACNDLGYYGLGPLWREDCHLSHLFHLVRSAATLIHWILCILRRNFFLLFSPAKGRCVLTPAENAAIGRQHEGVLAREGDIHDKVLGAVESLRLINCLECLLRLR